MRMGTQKANTFLGWSSCTGGSYGVSVVMVVNMGLGVCELPWGGFAHPVRGFPDGWWVLGMPG